MPGVPVYLDRPPRSATLVAWGRAPDAWWGCVVFRQPVATANGRDEIAVSAWVPSASVRRPNWTNASQPQVPRLTLERDRATWPAPQGWPAWFAGVWAAGALPLPPGLTVDTGPAWRN